MKFFFSLTIFSFLFIHAYAQDSSFKKIDSAISLTRSVLDDKDKVIEENQQAINKTQQEIKILEKSIDSLSNIKNKTENDFKKLENKYDLLKRKYDTLLLETKKLDITLNSKRQQSEMLDTILNLKKDTIVKQNKEVQELTSEQIKKRNEIDSVRFLIENLKDSIAIIAEVYMNTSKAPLHMESNGKSQNANVTTPAKEVKDKLKRMETGDSLIISSVKIRIREGQILSIQVFTNDGIYRNKSAPISLVTINEERNLDRLYAPGNKSDKFILLSSVINYIPRRTYSYFPYIDVEFALNKKDSVFFIKESTSLNSYFDVAVYTDLKGVSGDANGLAQININGKFITATKNIMNSAIVPFNFLTVNGFIAKFDNDFKGTYIDSVTKEVDRLKLFQTSYYRVGFKLNLLHWVLSPYPKRLIEDIQINLGYNFLGSRIMNIYIRDTTGSKKIYDTSFEVVTHNQFFLEPLIVLTRHSNFGCILSCPFLYQDLKKSSGVSNREFLWYFNPTINLYYSSKKSPNSKIFFKYSHFIDMKNPESAFSQAQLGYSANLTDIFNLTKQ